MNSSQAGIYLLAEDVAGHNAGSLGFPNVKSCMAFVARTSTDLWGLHISSTEITYTRTLITQFWQWASNKGLQATAITDLYGCCNRPVRYGDTNTQGAERKWLAEMIECAGLIGYTGPVRGFDFSIIAPRQGAYIEYRHMTTGSQPCLIFYKRWEKVTTSQSIAMPYAGGAADVVRWDKSNNRFAGMGFAEQQATGNSSLLHTGEFHEVDYALRLNSFKI